MTGIIGFALMYGITKDCSDKRYDIVIVRIIGFIALLIYIWQKNR